MTLKASYFFLLLFIAFSRRLIRATPFDPIFLHFFIEQDIKNNSSIVPTLISLSMRIAQISRKFHFFFSLYDLGGKGSVGSLSEHNSRLNLARSLEILTPHSIKSELLQQYSVAAGQLCG